MKETLSPLVLLSHHDGGLIAPSGKKKKKKKKKKSAFREEMSMPGYGSASGDTKMLVYHESVCGCGYVVLQKRKKTVEVLLYSTWAYL